MKRRTKVFLITIFLGIILLGYVYSKLDFSEVITSFKNFTIRWFLPYILAITLIEFFLVVRWKVILNAFNYNVPFHSLFFYRMGGYTVGYMSPQAHVGGEPVRALLLKRHGVPFKKGISTVVIDKSMQITTDLLFAFIGATMVFLHFSISKRIELFIYGFILFAVLLLGFYFYCMIKNKPFFSAILNLKFLEKFKKIKKMEKHILEIEKTIHTFYTAHFRSFITIISINLVLYVLMTIEYSSAMALFGFSPNLYRVIILMGAVALSYSMPVPMALGVLEASQTSALGLLSLNPAIGLAISLLIRIKDILRSTIGGIALLFFGIDFGLIWKQIKDKEDEKTVKDIQIKKTKDKKSSK